MIVIDCTRDRRAAADGHAADVDLPGPAALGDGADLHGALPQRSGDVEVQPGHEQEQQHDDHAHRERHQLRHVREVAPVAAAALAEALVDGDRRVPAVERAAAGTC